MEVNHRTLSWETYDDSNSIIDMFTLKSRIPELTLPDANPAGGTLALVLSGKPGQKYILERSGDLLSWTPFATNTIATAGDSLVTNVVPVNASPRFFRARL